VLRIDDDEMPSPLLLQWLHVNLHAFTLPHATFPRRWALFAPDGTLGYARRKEFYSMPGQPQLLDPQVRLFQPDKLRCALDLQTAGFALQGATYVAPPAAYICHFDWILRDLEQRREELRKHEAIFPGSSASCSHFYLPELVDRADLREAPFENTAFDELALAFAQARTRARARMAA
jgi:hypothetical protein